MAAAELRSSRGVPEFGSPIGNKAGTPWGVDRKRSGDVMLRMIPIAVLSAVAVLASPARSQQGALSPDAAWQQIAGVLTSPRCLNCHPRADRPTQGDDMHPHRPGVQRGAEGNGV